MDGNERAGYLLGAITVCTRPDVADTDGDMLFDGTEWGLALPETPDTDRSKGHFVADANQTTKTDASKPDTDGDGLYDGFNDGDNDDILDSSEMGEDVNLNGEIDEGETNPNKYDTDGDGLSDGAERNGWNINTLVNGVFGLAYVRTDPNDKDSDDDGIEDKVELETVRMTTGGTNYFTNPSGVDANNDYNPDGWDTDGDGLSDGQEVAGWDVMIWDDRVKAMKEPRHVTSSPLVKDTDADGVIDKDEYINGAGPSDADKDTDGDFILDAAEIASENPANMSSIDGAGPEIKSLKFKFVEESCIEPNTKIKVITGYSIQITYKIRDPSGVKWVNTKVDDRSFNKTAGIPDATTDLQELSVTFPGLPISLLTTGCDIVVRASDANGNIRKATAHIPGGFDIIAAWIDAALSWFQQAVSAAAEAINQAANWIWERMNNAFKSFLGPINDGLVNYFKNIQNVLVGILAEYVPLIGHPAEITARMIDWSLELFSALTGNILNPLIDGIRSLVNLAKPFFDLVQGLATQLTNYFIQAISGLFGKSVSGFAFSADSVGNLMLEGIRSLILGTIDTSLVQVVQTNSLTDASTSAVDPTFRSRQIGIDYLYTPRNIPNYHPRWDPAVDTYKPSFLFTVFGLVFDMIAWSISPYNAANPANNWVYTLKITPLALAIFCFCLSIISLKVVEFLVSHEIVGEYWATIISFLLGGFGATLGFMSTIDSIFFSPPTMHPVLKGIALALSLICNGVSVYIVGDSWSVYKSFTSDPDSDGLPNALEDGGFEIRLAQRSDAGEISWDSTIITLGTHKGVVSGDYLPLERDYDTDYDGLWDGDELNLVDRDNNPNRYITDPNDPDTDGDGLLDGYNVEVDLDEFENGLTALDRDKIDTFEQCNPPIRSYTLNDGMDRKRIYYGEPSIDSNGWESIPVLADTDGDGVMDGRDINPTTNVKIAMKVTWIRYLASHFGGLTITDDTTISFTIEDEKQSEAKHEYNSYAFKDLKDGIILSGFDYEIDISDDLGQPGNYLYELDDTIEEIFSTNIPYDSDKKYT